MSPFDTNPRDNHVNCTILYKHILIFISFDSISIFVNKFGMDQGGYQPTSQQSTGRWRAYKASNIGSMCGWRPHGGRTDNDHRPKPTKCFATP